MRRSRLLPVLLTAAVPYHYLILQTRYKIPRVCSVPYVPRRTAGISGTGHFVKFGTSIPVPDTSVSSVWHPYRYRPLRQIRYDMDTGTGTTSIPVPDTSVSSVRHSYRYREYRYRTEHSLNTGTAVQVRTKAVFFTLFHHYVCPVLFAVPPRLRVQSV